VDVMETQVIVSIVFVSSQIIHCEISGAANLFVGFISFTYGHSSASQ